MYPFHRQLEGSDFRLNYTQGQYPKEPGFYHAQIKLVSGTMRGMSLFLTYFTAELIPNADDILCKCKAYPFPHRRGEERCNCNPELIENSDE